MLRRAVTFFLLTAALATPAHAQSKLTLMPGVTFEQSVQFTSHGPVVIHVITAPKPGGLWGFGPALARSTIVGGRERVTDIQKDVSAQATVAGINGDLFNWNDSHPSGIYLQDGVLEHAPLSGRSSIGITRRRPPARRRPSCSRSRPPLRTSSWTVR